MTPIKEDAEMEKARKTIYTFFSSFFLHPPSAETLKSVLNADGARALKALFPGHPAASRFTDMVKEYQEGKVATEEFLLDFEALFRIPGDSFVYPFESIYVHEQLSHGRPKQALLLRKEAREVALLYEAQDLSPKEDFMEFPDHLAVELEFMAFLCHKRAVALDEGKTEEAAVWQTRQRSFLFGHLHRWAPHCLAKIRENAATPLYATLAQLLDSFLEDEARTQSQL